MADLEIETYGKNEGILPEGVPRVLPYELFGNNYSEIWDFKMRDYNHFLDNVRTFEDLLKGLEILGPLADDAFEVARTMTSKDFYEFKIALAYERRLAREEQFEDSKMPNKYDSILLPKKFVPASFMADKFEVDLGCALVRLIEIENNKQE